VTKFNEPASSVIMLLYFATWNIFGSSWMKIYNAWCHLRRGIMMTFKGLLHYLLRAIRARYHYYIHFDIDSLGHPSQPIIRLRATYANESRDRVTALRTQCFKAPRAKWTASLSLHLRHATPYEYKGENYVANTTKGIYMQCICRRYSALLFRLNFFLISRVIY